MIACCGNCKFASPVGHPSASKDERLCKKNAPNGNLSMLFPLVKCTYSCGEWERESVADDIRYETLETLRNMKFWCHHAQNDEKVTHSEIVAQVLRLTEALYDILKEC